MSTATLPVSPPAPASPDLLPDAASGDVRVQAVLSVLRGQDLELAATAHDVLPELLERWTAAFIDAGTQGLAGTGGDERLAAHQRDRHLSLVAHELRTPVAVIRGWADVLGTDPDAAVRHRALEGITAQTDRLTRLSADVLDITAVALGRLRLQPAPAELGQAVIAHLRTRGADASVRGGTEQLPVRIDAQRFGQMLDNLLDNAEAHGAGRPTISLARRGDFAEVAVTSPGPPISPETARGLFEPFARGDSAAAGSGLGLYLCRSLAVAHGGVLGLRVTPTSNQFWLRFPLDCPGASDAR